MRTFIGFVAAFAYGAMLAVSAVVMWKISAVLTVVFFSIGIAGNLASLHFCGGIKWWIGVMRPVYAAMPTGVIAALAAICYAGAAAGVAGLAYGPWYAVALMTAVGIAGLGVLGAVAPKHA